MGLDAVELVMAVEEEFIIDIPDDEAERMKTVGDLYSYVHESVHLKAIRPPSDEELWQRVRKVVVAQLGVKEHQVTREARFIEDLGMD